VDSPRCLVRQRHEIGSIGAPLQRLVASGLAQPRPDDAAVERVAAAVHKVDERVRAYQFDEHGLCRHPPVALDPLRMAAGVLEVRPPARRGLRHLVSLFEQWEQRVGRPHSWPIVFAAHPCTHVRERVTATYAVRYRPGSKFVPGGKTGWVEIRLENRSGVGVAIEHWGSLLARGLASAATTQRLTWGASSADYAEAGAGATTRTTVYPAWGPSGELPLQPWGSLEVLDFGATLYAGPSSLCPIDVNPLSG